MNVTAIVERSGNWWAVAIPEVEGGFTQARRLDLVPEMVADLVELATGTPAADVKVAIDTDTRQADELRHARKRWAEAARLQAEARRLQDEAAAMARGAVAELRGLGLTVRDVATLLEVSPQRVSQLDRPASGRGRP